AEDLPVPAIVGCQRNRGRKSLSPRREHSRARPPGPRRRRFAENSGFRRRSKLHTTRGQGLWCTDEALFSLAARPSSFFPRETEETYFILQTFSIFSVSPQPLTALTPKSRPTAMLHRSHGNSRTNHR